MQRYWITDGKNYIRKIKHKYTTCNSAVMATTFAKREAENILMFSLRKCYQGYWIEGVEDCSKITKEEINVEKTDKNSRLRIIRQETEVVDDDILDDIETKVKNFTDMDFLNKEKLVALRNKLEKSVSFYDQAMSDIYHWIGTHNPPANIMSKVYVSYKQLVQKRARTKQSLAYIKAFCDNYNENIGTVQSCVKQQIYTDYVPKTYIYGELDKLTKRKEVG